MCGTAPRPPVPVGGPGPADVDRPAAPDQERPGDGETAGPGRGPPLNHPLSHHEGHGDNQLPTERGSLENAQALAAHESSQTTRLYDHSGDHITLDEIERIRF